MKLCMLFIFFTIDPSNEIHREERVEWMYHCPPEHENKLDEEFTVPKQVKGLDSTVVDLTNTEAVPGSKFIKERSLLRENEEKKEDFSEDPLDMIRRKEENKIKAILENPEKLRIIRESILKEKLEKELGSSKKKSKRDKRDKKGKKDKKDKKDKKRKRDDEYSRDRKHRRSDDGSPKRYDSDEDRRRRDRHDSDEDSYKRDRSRDRYDSNEDHRRRDRYDSEEDHHRRDRSRDRSNRPYEKTSDYKDNKYDRRDDYRKYEDRSEEKDSRYKRYKYDSDDEPSRRDRYNSDDEPSRRDRYDSHDDYYRRDRSDRRYERSSRGYKYDRKDDYGRSRKHSNDYDSKSSKSEDGGSDNQYRRNRDSYSSKKSSFKLSDEEKNKLIEQMKADALEYQKNSKSRIQKEEIEEIDEQTRHNPNAELQPKFINAALRSVYEHKEASLKDRISRAKNFIEKDDEF